MDRNSKKINSRSKKKSAKHIFATIKQLTLDQTNRKCITRNRHRSSDTDRNHRSIQNSPPIDHPIQTKITDSKFYTDDPSTTDDSSNRSLLRSMDRWRKKKNKQEDGNRTLEEAITEKTGNGILNSNDVYKHRHSVPLYSIRQGNMGSFRVLNLLIRTVGFSML